MSGCASSMMMRGRGSSESIFGVSVLSIVQQSPRRKVTLSGFILRASSGSSDFAFPCPLLSVTRKRERGLARSGGSVKVTCVRKMADAAALYCVFYLH